MVASAHFQAKPLMLVLWCYCGLTAASPAAMVASTADIAGLSLEELLEIEVISVSKKAEPLFTAPAAVYVITGEQIRRSGARTLPDALRLAPGVEVALTGPRSAAISIRGFNETSADKLEVLVDGRSVYTPLTSAVFWQALDVLLEDIERIEVVRGPGGTIWGANAVNGVINIVTRSSLEDAGDLVALRAGTELTGSAALRMSHKLGDNAAIRSYAIARDFDETRSREGAGSDDSLRIAQAGFRSDWAPSQRQALRLSGDLYAMRATTTVIGGEQLIEDDRDGGNINLSWSRSDAAGREFSIASYVDWYRLLIPDLFNEHRETFDLDMRYRFDWGSWNQVTLGLSYRRSKDETGGPPLAVFVEPLNRSVERPGAFIQDRMSFLDGRLKLTLGSKFEHNDFTGTEVQPSIRLGYAASDNSFIALSLAQAVRTPNRFDDGAAIFCSEGLEAAGFCEGGGNFRLGNPELKAEQLTAVELIFRQRFGQRYSLDLAVFSNAYKNLATTEPDPPPFGLTTNSLEADSWGAELALNAYLKENLSITAWLSTLDLSVDDSRSNDAEARSRIEGSSPDFQASLAVRWSPGAWQLDAIGRYVDELAFVDDDGVRQQARGYGELDLRLARQLGPNLSLGLIGRNLLHSAHAEFPSSDVEMQQAVLVELVWEPGANQ